MIAITAEHLGKRIDTTDAERKNTKQQGNV
jgi:hypothetical protein